CRRRRICSASRPERPCPVCPPCRGRPRPPSRCRRPPPGASSACALARRPPRSRSTRPDCPRHQRVQPPCLTRPPTRSRCTSECPPVTRFLTPLNKKQTSSLLNPLPWILGLNSTDQSECRNPLSVDFSKFVTSSDFPN